LASASAKALQSLAVNRREALWQSVVAAPDWDILADKRMDDETPALDAPSEAEDIVSEYNAAGLTLGHHPRSLLRPSCWHTGICKPRRCANPNERLARLRTCHSEAATEHRQGRHVVSA
jgi:hypothetical protein